MFKKFAVRLLGSLAFLSVLIFASCSDSLNDKNDVLLGMLAAANAKAVQYGSLTINSSDSRALNVSDISYVYAAVSGTGISSPITAKSETITDGSGSGSITITGIPVGKNRVVTVYAYDSSNQKLGTVMIRAVTDIEAGNKNSVTVNQSTTLLGNVFAELLAKGVNLASVEKSAVQTKLAGASENWALYDAAAIASDYVTSGSASGIKAVLNYKLSTGSVSFTSYYESCTVQISDPVSSIKTNVASGEGSVTGVAPGTWPVYVIVSGETVKKTYVTVTSGADTNIGNLGTVTDRIIVHAKYTHVWAWTTGNTSDNLTGGNWPGRAMTDEGNGWYVYAFETGKTAIDVLLSNNGSNKSREEGGDSLTAGEWWYKDSTWYEANPDDSEAPVLVSFTADKSGTVSENVVLSVEATDNLNLSKAVLTMDGVALTTINLSGKTSTITYTWETAYIANGSHVIKAVVYDSANLASNEKTLSFTTSNANLPPVAKISGPKKMSPGKTLTYKGTDSYDQNGGTIASYKWTVTGAAATSSLTGETLTVTAPSTVGATFKVSLVVKDNEGASSDSVSLDCETIDVDANWDFRDETIYFLMTTRFYDGDSSNNRYCWDDEVHLKSKTNNDPGWRGDFKGLIDRLDYIKALGFTAIWITPVVENASGLDYHGYHATDFSKVDPRYESTGATYQDLIDKAHEKGIKIIQDIVLNHCSNSGEKHILPMTVKKYDSDNGVDCVPMVPDHNATDIYGRNTYELLNKGVKKLTGGKYNTYEELEKDANHYYDDAARGKLMYESRIYSMNNGLDIDNDEVGKLFHYQPGFEWENVNLQRGTMAGDCVDLNTENPKVAEYLRNCYIKYIQMGVDAFRIDTLKHISRLTMNKEFIPQFHEAAAAAGNDKFFMFGEACVKRNEVWNGNLPPISVCFYTWNQNKNKTDASYPWKGVSDYVAAAKDNLLTIDDFNDDNTIGVQLESNNVFLNGNDYHEPDYSKYSGLSVIDFYMHHKFKDPGNAIDAANQEDRYINDASWAVTYVDSHDFGPNEGGMLLKRFNLGTAAWAENLDLMFTFRGIPCVYYGSEVEFQAGKQIEPWCDSGKVPYNESGRAYFGDHLEGTISADGTGEYSASGAIKETLDSTLSQHIMRLNQIRAAVPALRKGQYSFENCNGSNAFKRRYTSNNVDSFAVVSISGSATFTGLPAGKYIDVVSGDVQTIGEGGTIKSKNSGQGSMAVYVNATLDSSITGKIGKDGAYLK
ncbi:MAG: alpha-amylase family glycosyl hydrolase [Treponema sp.]|nr:alpha-amylase family glycosyl hydrolase [Treponema sp.]